MISDVCETVAPHRARGQYSQATFLLNGRAIARISGLQGSEIPWGLSELEATVSDLRSLLSESEACRPTPSPLKLLLLLPPLVTRASLQTSAGTIPKDLKLVVDAGSGSARVHDEYPKLVSKLGSRF